MDLLERTAHEILASADPWPALVAAGLTTIGLPEERGGSGGTLAEAATVLRIAAYHAASVPLAETCWLAGWALTESELSVPGGKLALMLGTGSQRVAWASEADHLVVVGDGRIALVDPSAARITPGRNLAGEPSEEVVLSEEPERWTPTRVTGEGLLLRGALARSVQICGGARRALDLCLAYVAEREQFGRPIARFQAIQHHIAELAGEVAVLEAASRAAVNALADTSDDPAARQRALTAVAATKANAGRAASTAARIAHQIHGAIGLTEEHPLRQTTLRLWSWRDDHGPDSYWETALGSSTHPLWQTLTS